MSRLCHFVLVEVLRSKFHFGEEMCPIVAVEMSMRLGLQAIRRGNKFSRRNLVTAKTYFLAFGNEYDYDT